MIKVKRLNQEEFYINPSLIQTIEKKPDTMITMINSKKYIVADSIEELLKSITEYYKVAGLISPQIIFNSYDFGTDERYLDEQATPFIS